MLPRFNLRARLNQAQISSRLSRIDSQRQPTQSSRGRINVVQVDRNGEDHPGTGLELEVQTAGLSVPGVHRIVPITQGTKRARSEVHPSVWCATYRNRAATAIWFSAAALLVSPIISVYQCSSAVPIRVRPVRAVKQRRQKRGNR